MPPNPKFIQIETMMQGDIPLLFALDEAGQVWQLSQNNNHWGKVTAEREE